MGVQDIWVSNLESVAWISHKWLIPKQRAKAILFFLETQVHISGYLWRRIKKIATPTFVSLSSAGCFAEGLLDTISSDLHQSDDSLVCEIKY